MDFETTFNNCEIAYSPFDVDRPAGYKNIRIETIIDKFKVSVGLKEGSNLLRTTLKLNDEGHCLSRKSEHLTETATLLVIDCDNSISVDGIEEGAPNPEQVHLILKNENIGHILVGTYSHYEQTKGNRFRIFLTTKQPYNKSQLPPIVESIIAIINSKLDGCLLALANENNVYAQAFYLPRKPNDCKLLEIYYSHLQGSLVEVVNPLPELIPKKKGNHKFYVARRAAFTHPFI